MHAAGSDSPLLDLHLQIKIPAWLTALSVTIGGSEALFSSNSRLVVIVKRGPYTGQQQKIIQETESVLQTDMEALDICWRLIV